VLERERRFGGLRFLFGVLPAGFPVRNESTHFVYRTRKAAAVAVIEMRVRPPAYWPKQAFEP
jgi:hypothetical protein